MNGASQTPIQSESGEENSSLPSKSSLGMIPLRARLLASIPAAIVMVAIFCASSLHGDEAVLPDFVMSDKLAHFCIYSLLGITLSMRSRWMQALSEKAPVFEAKWLWLLGWLFGLSDEFHQIFVPGRQAGMDDWIADALGVLFGWYMMRLPKKT